MENFFVWVYQYDAPENGVMVRHSTFRTQASIERRGGVVLLHTGRQVAGYEVTDGIWRPDRNPVS